MKVRRHKSGGEGRGGGGGRAIGVEFTFLVSGIPQTCFHPGKPLSREI